MDATLSLAQQILDTVFIALMKHFTLVQNIPFYGIFQVSTSAHSENLGHVPSYLGLIVIFTLPYQR